MLKKALAVATLAVASTGAVLPAAHASDATGGNYSQNISILPHLCIDAKDVANNLGNGAGVPITAFNGFEGQQCNEDSKVVDNHKEPLSDLADIGSHQH